MLQDGTARDSLDSLWSWATAEVRAARMAPPYELHSQTGPRDDWGHIQSEAIRGLPFSRPMERYLSGGLSKVWVSALASLRPLPRTPDDRYSDRAGGKLRWKVISAVVRGDTDVEAVRARLGLSQFAFQVCAVNGLLALRSALSRSEA